MHPPRPAPASKLYVGGSFTTAGGLGAKRIARYDGLAWFVQAFVRDGEGGRWLSAPATPVVIDSSS